MIANRKETIQRSATREQCVILRPKLRLNCASIYGGMHPGQSSKDLSRVAKDARLHSIWPSRHSRVLLYYLDARAAHSALRVVITLLIIPPTWDHPERTVAVNLTCDCVPQSNVKYHVMLHVLGAPSDLSFMKE